MKIKKSYLNAFEKAARTSYFYNYLNFPGVTEDSKLRAKNPFSGAEAYLTPLEASIYEWCCKWYEKYSAGFKTEVPVSVYDNMRYYFMSINPAAYMELLD